MPLKELSDHFGHNLASDKLITVNQTLIEDVWVVPVIKIDISFGKLPRFPLLTIKTGENH